MTASERTPQLCWVYKYKDQGGLLICVPSPSRRNNRTVLYVLNGDWELQIERDGDVSSAHAGRNYAFLGFVWGNVDDLGLNYEDALDRFEKGERADPGMCRHCLGAGKVPLNELVILTTSADLERVKKEIP